MKTKHLAFGLILFMLWSTPFAGQAQNDSIVFTNNNYIVGEIKDLNQGIIKIETDYSDNDFTIEWNKILIDMLFNQFSHLFDTDPLVILAGAGLE